VCVCVCFVPLHKGTCFEKVWHPQWLLVSLCEKEKRTTYVPVHQLQHTNISRKILFQNSNTLKSVRQLGYAHLKGQAGLQCVNIILASTLSSGKWFLVFRFADHNFVCILRTITKPHTVVDVKRLQWVLPYTSLLCLTEDIGHFTIIQSHIRQRFWGPTRSKLLSLLPTDTRSHM
jgi:hypothetical protein